MLGIWYVRHVECSRRGMFVLWDVPDLSVWAVGCLGCEMLGMWGVWNVECWRYGMLGMWNVGDVGCPQMWVFGLSDV